MNVDISLVECWHYVSDIREVWDLRRNVPVEQIGEVIQDIMKNEHFDSVLYPTVIIVVERSWPG